MHKGGFLLHIHTYVRVPKRKKERKERESTKGEATYWIKRDGENWHKNYMCQFKLASLIGGS